MALLKKILIILFLLSFLSSPLVMAGSVSGPFVVWVNLDDAFGNSVDEQIRAFADSKVDNCDGDWLIGSSMIYMKKRPPSITDKLVNEVFVKRNKPAMKRLQRALLTYKDEDIGHDGFDGIMVYLNQGGPRILSLSTHGKKIKEFVIDEGRPGSHIEDVFCSSLPPIARKP